ncbi:MAG: HD domain-containing protein [Actinomycetota bacterium]|nr:HD domain-containing protein [Actinomycetota bacterium]
MGSPSAISGPEEVHLNGTVGRRRLSEILESERDAIASKWLNLTGEQRNRWPEIGRYLTSLIDGLADVFRGRGWRKTQDVIDEIAERRVRAGVGLEQGLQRAFLAGRHVVPPLCGEENADECEELLLEALHECVFRFSESYQGMRMATESERMHSRIIKSLVMSLEARDPYTKGHSISVAILSQRIAEVLKNVDPSRVYLAGLLHDVGKIGIPDNILMKPGPLTAEEWKVMKSHPVVGASILKPIKLYADVVSAVLTHHENHDGSGYPYGVTGSDIPVISRIIRVADSFDAMTTTRAHRRSRSADDAVIDIRDKRGTSYDPETVDAFMQIIHKPGTMSELSLATLQIDLGEFVL